MWTPLATALVIIAVSVVEAFLVSALISVYFKERTQEMTRRDSTALKQLIELGKTAEQKKKEE